MLIGFHALFELHAKDVYRFAVYLTGDPSLAEEITQETFVRAWVTSGEIRNGTAKAYLLTIARNLYLAEKKRASRHVGLDSSYPDPKPGPNATAGGRLALAEVFEALQSLPEVDRAALLMHVQEGLPYVEIAAGLGLSVAAIKVRVHRARLKLRQLCEPKEDKT